MYAEIRRTPQEWGTGCGAVEAARIDEFLGDELPATREVLKNPRSFMGEDW